MRDDVNSATMTCADAATWAAKAQRLARPLLCLPHSPSAATRIDLFAHDDADDSEYGEWMLSWPEQQKDRQVLHHLTDGSAFLGLLADVYAPVLSSRPALRRVLNNRSRLEMSITNDVLQLQLTPVTGHYCMIRHHSLMLFESILWLDPASRAGWGELCTLTADVVMEERAAAPSTQELDDIENAGFECMRTVRLASDTESELRSLTRSGGLEPVAEYLRWATVGIAVLWRDWAAREIPTEMDWHDRQLAR
jgi:hypothetical protein